MKGLLLKDFYVLIKQLKLFLAIIPFMALMGGMSLSTVAIFIGSLLPMTAIAHDERSKWNELATMMPYSKSSLVISKYLLGYLCTVATALLVIVGYVVSKLVNLNTAELNLNTIYFSLFCALLFIAIDMPVLFKFGSEKGRFVFIGAMAVIGATAGAANNINVELLNKLIIFPPILLLSLAVVLNILSIKLSIYIQRKKE